MNYLCRIKFLAYIKSSQQSKAAKPWTSGIRCDQLYANANRIYFLQKKKKNISDIIVQKSSDISFTKKKKKKKSSNGMYVHKVWKLIQSRHFLHYFRGDFRVLTLSILKERRNIFLTKYPKFFCVNIHKYEYFNGNIVFLKKEKGLRW